MSEPVRVRASSGAEGEDPVRRRVLLHALVTTLRAAHAREASLEPIVTAPAASPAPSAPAAVPSTSAIHASPPAEGVEADEPRALVSIAVRAGAAGVLVSNATWPLLQILDAMSGGQFFHARLSLATWVLPPLAFVAVEAGGAAAREILEEPRALAPPYAGIPRGSPALLRRAVRFGLAGLAVTLVFALVGALLGAGNDRWPAWRALGFAAMGALLGLRGGPLSSERGAVALGLGAAAASLVWSVFAVLPAPLLLLLGRVDWGTACAAAAYMWALRRSGASSPPGA